MSLLKRTKMLMTLIQSNLPPVMESASSPNCSLCLGSVLPLGQHRLRCHTEEAKMPVVPLGSDSWRALCRFVIKSYLLNLALRLTHALRCFDFLAYLILHLPSVIYRNSLVSHSLHIRPLFCMDLYPAQQVSFFSLDFALFLLKGNIKQYLLPRVSCALCCQGVILEKSSVKATQKIFICMLEEKQMNKPMN